MSVYAYAEAVHVIEQAMAVQEILDPDDKQRRCDLLLELADALMPAGEALRAAEVVAEEAFSLAHSLGALQHASKACEIAVESLGRYGGIPASRTPMYEKWAQRADSVAPEGTVARVNADLAVAAVLEGRNNFQASRTLVERALDRAVQLADDETAFHAAVRLLQRCAPGDEAENLRIATDTSRQPRTNVRPRTAMLYVWNAGQVFFSWGNREAAEESWRVMDELAGRTADPNIVLRPIWRDATLLTLDGHLEEAAGLRDLIRNRANELGIPTLGQLVVVNATARALLYLGRALEALSDFERTSTTFAGDPTPARTALYLAHAGQLTEARRRFIDSSDLWHASADKLVPSYLLCMGLETALILQDEEATATLQALLLPAQSLFSRTPGGEFTSVARHLGDASSLLGRHDEARAHYARSLEICERVRFRPEIALTHLGLAELLLEHYSDERSAAIEHLDFAIAEFREMKMQPSLERALRHRGLLKA
jgi:tetratricopeptide (TPR) repeat protein